MNNTDAQLKAIKAKSKEDNSPVVSSGEWSKYRKAHPLKLPKDEGKTVRFLQGTREKAFSK